MKVKFSIILLPLLLLMLIPVIAANPADQTNSLIAQNMIRKIAFAAKANGHSAIYTINDDGTELKKLTTNNYDAIGPQWSADRARILYLSRNGDKYELRIMNSDGGNPKRLADNCDPAFPPAWSPDNQRILFVLNGKFHETICTVNADDGNLAVLTENNTDNVDPAWSPDGNKILYLAKNKNQSDIRLMNQDGTDRQQLTTAGFYSAPAWSPDGKSIACVCPTTPFYTFFSRNKICLMDANSHNQEDLTDGDDPRWSPDGSMITFTRCVQVKLRIYAHGVTINEKLYGCLLLNVQGNSHYQALVPAPRLGPYSLGSAIVRTLAGGNDHDQLLASMSATPCYSSWAPDSAKIAVVIDGKLMLYNINEAAGINVATALPRSLPKWSPDSKKIMWIGRTRNSEKSSLYVATADGKTITQLTGATVDASDPVWSP